MEAHARDDVSLARIRTDFDQWRAGRSGCALIPDPFFGRERNTNYTELHKFTNWRTTWNMIIPGRFGDANFLLLRSECAAGRVLGDQQLGRYGAGARAQRVEE